MTAIKHFSLKAHVYKLTDKMAAKPNISH